MAGQRDLLVAPLPLPAPPASDPLCLLRICFSFQVTAKLYEATRPPLVLPIGSPPQTKNQGPSLMATRAPGVSPYCVVVTGHIWDQVANQLSWRG